MGPKAVISALGELRVEFGTRLGAPGQLEQHGKTLTERKKQKLTNHPPTHPPKYTQKSFRKHIFI